MICVSPTPLGIASVRQGRHAGIHSPIDFNQVPAWRSVRTCFLVSDGPQPGSTSGDRQEMTQK